MPGRRAAVVVLSAALVAGAVAGGTVASSHLDPWGLLTLAGLSHAKTPEATRGPTPTPTVTVTVSPRSTSGPVKPTRYVTERFDVAGMEHAVDVPDGWKRIDQSSRWHDFLDPTLNLRLRIRFDRVGTTAQAAAEAAYAKRRDELADFRSPGVDRITTRIESGTARERTVTFYEFRYTSSEKEGTRYGAEWYLDGSTMIGGFGWAGQLDLVESAMVRARESIEADGA